MLTEVFLSFAISSFIACFLALSRQLYRSKCKSFKCCGIEIERDVQGEEKYDELEIQNSKVTREEKENKL